MYLKKKQDNNGYFDISSGLGNKVKYMLDTFKDVENSLDIYISTTHGLMLHFY